ncbi:MAG: M14 family metallopeptidase [Gemmatirosa sp.]
MPPRPALARRRPAVRVLGAVLATAACTALAALPSAADAQARRAASTPRTSSVPAPSALLGLEVGADRVLADWGQITRYFASLPGASPMVKVDTLGRTTQGRPLIVATISSPENIRNLATIRQRQARLADPRGLSTEEEARIVAQQPAVVMITCNIHSTEIASSQMAMELAHRLVTNDTLRRSLDDVVLLLVPSLNPDGQQMVTDWYKKGLGTPFEGGPLPWLYHHYVGHDNNRDWYMATQVETRLVTDLLYRRWFPTVFYDVHQQGNSGMRLTIPPHVDPINPNVDPLIVRGINHIGMEMALALEERGKTGVGDGATYDLWWHGGARSTPTRHNMVGLLTEAASVRIATPITQKQEELTGHPRGLPRYEQKVNFPNPWPGGTWRLRDIMDYELIAAEALVRMLGQQRDQYVRNFAQLGRKQVRLGEAGGPWAYVIPATQRDPGAAARLVEVLRIGGVEVERATAAFTANGKSYPAGSHLVKMAQPYRAHAKDLLEVQRFPKMERYPGGPQERPYDVAGWTLPFQFGVAVDEVAQRFEVAASPVREVDVTTLRDRCGAAPSGGAQYRVLDARDTRSYAVAMSALARGVPVRIAQAPVAMAGGATAAAGSFVLERADDAAARACTEGGAVATLPAGRTLRSAPRVGLYKPWTGNMDEGWTRWVFDQHKVAYTSVPDSVMRAGNLRARFDVLVVSDMALREAERGLAATAAPAQYTGGLGAPGTAALKAFVEAGGTLLLFDRAAELATGPLGLQVRRIAAGGRGGEAGGGADADSVRVGGAPREQLYAPGSVLRTLVDTSHPIAAGMSDTTAVYFTNSTTLDVSQARGARVLARYPERGEDILMSGFLTGASQIAGKAAAAEVPLGQGRVVMFGFRPQYRGQSLATFKMLFNAILTSPSGDARPAT